MVDLDTLVSPSLTNALATCLANHESCAKLGGLCTVTACGNVTEKLDGSFDLEGEEPRLWFSAYPRSGIIAHRGGEVALFVSELFLDDRMPRRLLRITNEEEEGNEKGKPRAAVARLVELGANAEHRPYVALSYCWGGSQFKMTSANRKNLMETGLSLTDGTVPVTYRDALAVTRALGFEYLWIDALCIVQDSAADWYDESIRMGVIYGQAACTLHAVDSTCADSGLVPPEGGTGALASPGVLDTRAWTAQEMAVSPRSILFSQGGVRWVCREAELEIECKKTTTTGGEEEVIDNNEEAATLTFAKKHNGDVQNRYGLKKLFAFFRDWTTVGDDLDERLSAVLKELEDLGITKEMLERAGRTNTEIRKVGQTIDDLKQLEMMSQLVSGPSGIFHELEIIGGALDFSRATDMSLDDLRFKTLDGLRHVGKLLVEFSMDQGMDLKDVNGHYTFEELETGRLPKGMAYHMRCQMKTGLIFSDLSGTRAKRQTTIVTQHENAGKDWGKWLDEGDTLERVRAENDHDHDQADDPLDGVMLLRLSPFEARTIVPKEKEGDLKVTEKLTQVLTAWDELDIDYSTNRTRVYQTDEYQEFLYKWWDFLYHYTPRHLTFESDRFLALNGIGSLAQKLVRRTRNIWGLWKMEIIREMLWYVDPSHHEPGRHTDKWLAPSWSWASLKGGARIRNAYYERAREGTKLGILSVFKTEIVAPIGTTFDHSLPIVLDLDMTRNAVYLQMKGMLRRGTVVARIGSDGDSTKRCYELTLEPLARWSDDERHELRPDAESDFPLGVPVTIWAMAIAWLPDMAPGNIHMGLVLKRMGNHVDDVIAVDTKRDFTTEELHQERTFTRLGYLETTFDVQRDSKEIYGEATLMTLRMR